MARSKNQILCITGTILTIFGVAPTSLMKGLGLGRLMDHADKWPGIFALPLQLLLISLFLASQVAYPAGTGILCQRLSIALRNPPLSWSAGLSLPVSANIFMALQALPFLLLPAGTRIRPMLWASMMCLLAVAILVLGINAVVLTIKKERRIVVGLIGLLLTLTPLMAGVMSLRLVCNLRGLEMAE